MDLFVHLVTFLAIVVIFTAHGHEHHGTPTAAATGEHHDMKSNINKEHVLEHLEGIVNKTTDQMTPDELEFYNFKLHDFDNNSMIDGLELLGALGLNEEHEAHHDKDQTNKDHTKSNSTKPRLSDDQMITFVDSVMKDYDKNLDGYITYPEYIKETRKERHHHSEH